MSAADADSPAFPHVPQGMSFTGEDGYTSYQHPGHPGMSLRDYFAGQALIGLMANPETAHYLPERIAHDAFTAADAMIDRR